ncbi:MAG: 1-acyl-sn-glycerol-3-phosphate acyltransferase [Clostridia bacterium]|nr:1-acyl-sn-glycerol-3-phosphate acyltransferase [Clostridia bacterium]
MIECTSAIFSAIGTALIGYFSGWFGSAADIWKIVLTLVGLFVAVVALIFLAALVIHLTIDVNKPVKRPSAFHTFVFNCFISMIDRFFRIRLYVDGGERIPDAPCVFIMNHRSNFDPILLADRYKKKHILMISKPANFKKPIAGGFIHKAGYMAIDREDDRKALKTVLKAIGYLGEGYSIGIYPEGTRNKKDVSLLPFKHGSFKIAMRAKVPTVITAIHETQKIHKNFPLKGTRVYLHVIDVLYPEDYEGKTSGDISDYAADVMKKDIDAFESGKRSAAAGG